MATLSGDSNRYEFVQIVCKYNNKGNMCRYLSKHPDSSACSCSCVYQLRKSGCLGFHPANMYPSTHSQHYQPLLAVCDIFAQSPVSWNPDASFVDAVL